MSVDQNTVRFTLASPFTGPQRVVEPGVLPSRILDQTVYWIKPDGFQHRIDTLDTDTVKWVLDYILANARDLRERWAFEQKQSYDVGQKARRWMLDRPVTLALMRRLVQLADNPEELRRA